MSSGRLDFVSAFFRNAERHPSHPAIVIQDKTCSYGELADLAHRVAAWIWYHHGDPTQKVFGVIASRSLETYASLLGILSSGAAYLPLHPDDPRNASMAEQAGTTEIFSSDVALWAAIQKTTPRDQVPNLNPSSRSYVIFTSGTTGSPKGVVVQQDAVGRVLKSLGDLYSLTQTDRVAQFTDLTFDPSVWEVFLTLASGATLYVPSIEEKKRPDLFIVKHSITVWSSVPAVIANLHRQGLLRAGLFPSLRISYFVGEPLMKETARQWQDAAPNSVVDNHYGPTECTVTCTYHRFKKSSPVTRNRQILCIGQPYPEILIGIVNQRQFVSADQTGEIAISGPQLAQGYLGKQSLTQERFVHLHHPLFGYARWYLTGDLGYLDPNGNLFYMGRVDHQVKIKGHRIELGELDYHLQEVTGSSSVCSIGWPVDPDSGASCGIVSFYEQVGNGLAEEEVRTAMNRALPAAMQPDQVLGLDTLPRTSNGKIDRKKLAEIASQIQKIENRSLEEIKAQIDQIWNEKLKLPYPPSNEPFRPYIRDSIMIIRFAAEIWSVFDVAVSADTLFQNNSLQDLAKTIHKNLKESPAGCA